MIEKVALSVFGPGAQQVGLIIDSLDILNLLNKGNQSLLQSLKTI
jgi:hypothetical protein